MQNISALLVVKNEADRILRETLSGLNKFCSEIIVVDDNSTDSTVQVCSEFTEKIYKAPVQKSGNIPMLKKFGEGYTTNDWIFTVDADFIYSDAFISEVLSIEDDLTFDVIEVRLVDYLFGKWFIRGRQAQFQRRFYKKSSAIPPSDVVGPREHPFPNLGYRSIVNPIFHLGHPYIGGFINNMNRYTDQTSKNYLKTGIYESPFFNWDGKKISILTLITTPFKVFVFSYFKLDKSYKEGIHGFIWSSLLAIYSFLEVAKLFEAITNKEITIEKIDYPGILKKIPTKECQ